MRNVALAAVWLLGAAADAQDVDWTALRQRSPVACGYSAARRIDRTNVARLQLAWSYRTGAMQVETGLKRKAAFESTPILVENKLYLIDSLQPRDRARSADGRAGCGSTTRS